jgi:hypothetical protein
VGAVRDHLDRFGDALPVVVTFSDDLDLVAAHRRHLDVDFPVLADRDLALYRALGIGRGSVRDVWSPGTLATYARLLGSGRRLQRPTEDTRQLGADAVIDRSGRLVRAWRPSSPDARPPMTDLIAAVAAVDDWQPPAPAREHEGVTSPDGAHGDREPVDRRVGGDTVDVAADLAALGLPTDRTFLERWDGFSAEQILDAIDRGFVSGEQFAPWVGTDADIAEVHELAPLEHLEVDPAAVLAQLRSGATPAEIAFSVESGLKITKVQSWIRRGLSATAAHDWSAAGFSAKETARWAEVVADPDVAVTLLELGFDPAAAAAQVPEDGWTRSTVRRHVALLAGADVDSAVTWAATSLPDRKLRAWVESGVAAAEAEAWRSHGFGPRAAADWAVSSFAPAEAEAWRRADVSPEVAARRRAAGARPPAT